MQNFSFKEVIKSSWNWTKQFKKLWILGFFITTGGLIFQYDGKDWDNLQATMHTASFGNLFNHGFWYFVMFFGAFLLGFLIWLISIVAGASLIEGLGQIKQETKFSFWLNVKKAIKKSPNLIVFELIVFLLSFICLIPLFLYSFNIINLWLLGLAIFFLVVLVVFNVWIYIFKHYIYCYILFKNQNFWLAFKSGFNLLKNNFWFLIKTKLIEVGLLCLIGVVLFLAILITLIPVALLVILTMFGLGTVPAMIIGGIIGTALVASLLLVRAMVNVFFQTYLTNIFWSLEK